MSWKLLVWTHRAIASACLVVVPSACDRGPRSADLADTELPTRGPSPSSSATFQVDDDVALIEDDGTFDIDARVLQVGGELVRVIEDGPTHFAPIGWIPIAEGAKLTGKTHLTGKERHAPSGYQLRVGGGRMSREMWFPATQVFPAPWAGVAHLAVGDAVVKPRSGESPPSKCVITEVPTDAHSSVTARCDGAQYGEPVERKKLVRSLEPVTLAGIAPGDRVYVDNEQWAIVVGTSGTNLVIRETGVTAKDKIVALSRVRLAR